MKYSACIEVLYPQLPFEQRIIAAKNDGLSAVEFWAHAGKNLPEISKVSKAYDMPIAACCIATNNEERAKRFAQLGMTDYYSPAVFADVLKESIEVATKYDIPNLIVTSGSVDPAHERALQESYLIQCLIYAADLLKDTNITLVLEPLNLFDHPNTFLTRSDDAYRMLKTVNSDHVKMLFDIYHQQMTEGNLTENILKMLPIIGHFHTADVPGRHELGSGEINWKYIFTQIENAGYTGYCGLEYLTTCDTTQGLSYLKSL